MLEEHADRDPVEQLQPIADVGAVRAAQAALAGIEGRRRCAATWWRSARRPARDERVELGASPRAGLMLFRAAKALAALEGATTSSPTTSRRSPPRSSPTACSSPTRSTATSARRWFAKRSTRSPRCEMTPARDSGSPRAPATLALGAALILAGLASDSRRRWLPGSRCSPWPSARSPGWSWRRSAAGWSGRRGRPGSRRATPTRCGSACRRTLVPPPGGELSDPAARPADPGRPALAPRRLARHLAGAARADGAGARPARRPGPARALAAGARFRAHRRARGAAADRPGPLDRSRLGAARDRRRLRQQRRRHLAAWRPGAVRGRWPAPLPPGQPRVANPLAGGGAHRRDDRAAPDRRRGAQAAGCLRSARLLGRDLRERRCAPPPRSASSWRSLAAASCWSRASGARWRSIRPCAPGPRRTPRSPSPIPTPGRSCRRA